MVEKVLVRVPVVVSAAAESLLWKQRGGVEQVVEPGRASCRTALVTSAAL